MKRESIRHLPSPAIVFIVIFCVAIIVFFLFFKAPASSESDETKEHRNERERIHYAEKSSLENEQTDIKTAFLNSPQNNLENDIVRFDEKIAGSNTKSGQDSNVELLEGRRKLEETAFKNQFNVLAKTVAEESIDLEWSIQANKLLYEKLQVSDVFKQVDVQCKSTICEIDIEFSKPNNSGDGLEELEDDLPWNGAVFWRIEPEGKHCTMFISREGHRLPMKFL